MLMMHQTQRLVTLSREIMKMKRRDSLAILFLIICCENISKLQDGYHREGKSRYYVRRFFSDFVDSPSQEQLVTKMFFEIDEQATLEQIVDTLYAVRCDVVHAGKYWGFSFSDDGGITTAADGGEPPLYTRITLQQFSDIVAHGCIRAMSSLLPTAGPNPSS